jgi:YYY domain-containing protein
MSGATGDILRTWLAIQALGLIGLPLTQWLLRVLPDRGYAMSKILGLLLTGYLTWFLAMLGMGGFGLPLIIVSGLIVAGGGWWVLRRSHQRIVLPSWGRLVAYEALFLAAMLLVVWMRLRDPVPWGTERPMDFAFFNAILRSATFPPADPWLAGYSINYYYFGYLLMALVAQLTGSAPAVAYNLALALTFALTALGIAGLVANLMALAATPLTPNSSPSAGGEEPEQTVHDLAPHPYARLSAIGYRLSLGLVPLLAVIGVLVAGNQSGAVQVILGDERAVALDGRQFAAALRQSLQGEPTISLPHPAQTGDFGELTGWERRDKIADFNWWWPSRSLWDTYTSRDDPPTEQRRYSITEFPFFSFRLGDLHPHVMALPFGLLAMVLALAICTTPTRFSAVPLGWFRLGLSGLIVGSLYVINSWDLPTYLLLVGGALLLNHLRQVDRQVWRTLLRDLGILVIACWFLFIPFHLTFVSLVGGREPLIDLPLLGRITSIIGGFPATRSELHAFVIIFGLFALPLIAFVYSTISALSRSTTPAQPPSLGITAQSSTLSQWAGGERVFPWLPLVLLLLGMLVGFPLIALIGLGMLAAWIAWQHPERSAESFTLLSVVLGCAVLVGTEIIYIRDVFEGWSARFNTIFKFYYQVWLLWGSLAPFALWWALWHSRGVVRAATLAVGTLYIALLIGGLVYPAITLRDMSRTPALGLDGRTPRELSDAGRASIEWLRANAAPGSVVLELAELTMADGSRRGGAYNGDGGSGISATTGIPTVIGWVGHQQQWRGGDPAVQAILDIRRSDVETIYSTLDLAEAQRLLTDYGVRYVYIGGLERSAFAPASLDKFAQLGSVVFAQDDVVIYAIER